MTAPAEELGEMTLSAGRRRGALSGFLRSSATISCGGSITSRRKDAAASPVIGELHAPIGEYPRLGALVIENHLDVGMTRIVADRTKNPLQSLRRALQPLEEAALVVKDQTGDRLGAVAGLRGDRELVQVEGGHRPHSAAWIHNFRQRPCLDAKLGGRIGMVKSVRSTRRNHGAVRALSKILDIPTIDVRAALRNELTPAKGSQLL